MPKFVIERQYLVPMYQHIVVESENLETACEMAVSDDIDWDTQEMDSDNARKTTLTNAKVIPDCLELVAGDIILRRDRPATPGFGVPGYGLSTFLLRERGRDRPAPGDPGAVHRRRIIRHALSAAVEGLVASEPSGNRDRAENVSKNGLVFLGTAYVGVCRTRGARLRASLIPAPAPTSAAFSPARRSVWGVEALGASRS